MICEAQTFYDALDKIDYHELDQTIRDWEERGYECIDLFEDPTGPDFISTKNLYLKLLERKLIEDLIIINYVENDTTISALLFKGQREFAEHEILGIKEIQYQMSKEIFELQ